MSVDYDFFFLFYKNSSRKYVNLFEQNYLEKVCKYKLYLLNINIPKGIN